LKNNSVGHLKQSIDKHDIDCCSETFDDFDLEDCTLKHIISLSQLSWDPSLALVGKIVDQIWKTFSSDGGRWDEGEVLIKILVLPIQTGVQRLFSKGKNSLLVSILKLIPGMVSLRFKSISGVAVLLSLPSIKSINLV